MSDERPRGGTNARPLNDTVAGTGPGIPDDARVPGEEIPQPPSEEEVNRTAERMKAGKTKESKG